jgi:hypothetical protein
LGLKFAKFVRKIKTLDPNLFVFFKKKFTKLVNSSSNFPMYIENIFLFFFQIFSYHVNTEVTILVFVGILPALNNPYGVITRRCPL